MNLRQYLFIAGIFPTLLIYGQDKGIITDIDGNKYGTIVIGDQTWLAENLRTIRFANGDTIKTTSPVNSDISTEAQPMYQWFYNGDEKTYTDYGRLYTVYVVTDERNICPSGWHIPSKEEWLTLIASQGKIELDNDITGIASKAGDKLKEAGITHWKAPLSKATNKSGFSALPGGFRLNTGKFFKEGTACNFWTSSVDISGYWVIRISNDTGDVAWYKEKLSGIAYSVRCLEDK